MADLQRVGPVWGGTGTTPPLTAVISGAQRTADAHARFQDACLAGRVYATGSTTAALSANTITLTATTTPIVGVWNPATSKYNLVIWQAHMQIVVAGNSAVAPGGFVWASSVGNTVISTGNAPWNRMTLAQSGSVAKGFNPATALTGLTNNLIIMHGAAFGSLLVAQGATGTPIVSAPMVENIDGSIIVPPGGVLALLNTTSTTTISVTSCLVWEEVPVLT